MFITYSPSVWGSDIPPLPIGIDDVDGTPIVLQSAHITLYDAATREKVVDASLASLVAEATAAQWSPVWGGANGIPQPSRTTRYLIRWHLVDTQERHWRNTELFQWDVLPVDPAPP